MCEMTNENRLKIITEQYLKESVQIAKGSKKVGSKPTRVFLNSNKYFRFTSYVAEITEAEKLLAKLVVADKANSNDNNKKHLDRIYEILNEECKRLIGLNDFLWEVKRMTKENLSSLLGFIASKEERLSSLYSDAVDLLSKGANSVEDREISVLYCLFFGNAKEKNGKVNGLYLSARTFEGNIIKNLLYKLEDEGKAISKLFQSPSFKEFLDSIPTMERVIAREVLMDRLVFIVNSELFQGYVNLKKNISQGGINEQ